jgi:uncharacterized lipoprotein NlpE involved in copper resistance
MFVLTAAALTLVCAVCQSTGADKTAKDSIQWAGVYSGEILSVDASVINMQLQLYAEGIFEAGYRYRDDDDALFAWTGTFTWDAAGNIITLSSREIPSYYKVGNGILTQVDKYGKVIRSRTGNYALKKSE